MFQKDTHRQKVSLSHTHTHTHKHACISEIGKFSDFNVFTPWCEGAITLKLSLAF